ncbi:MAG: hypothetical protein LBL01_00140, partial [Bifidobacteriaceae bacterium]|nr:hypothetical protein [Bifidobacteriaceae bacterium]
NGKIPFGAVQVSPDEILMVPAQSANPAGGQELLRALLSKEAATNFAKTNKAPTVVKDSVPADGFGSAALASTMKLMADAGDNAYMFTGIHTDYYGLSNDAMPVWNGFLAGEISADDARAQLQEIYDRYAADTSKEKQTYE